MAEPTEQTASSAVILYLMASNSREEVPTSLEFSIIIPTFDRPTELEVCLDAVSRLEYPVESFEVIVVDDGGQNSLVPFVAPFRELFNLKLYRKENGGPASARNFGAAKAGKTFLAFVDDDCRPTPGWLSGLAAQLASNPHAAVGGATINILSDNIYSSASMCQFEYLYSFYNADPGRARFIGSGNLALSRRKFLESGGFDEQFTHASEDREFCHRWRQGGQALLYVQEAVVHHAHSLDFRGFWRQQYSYGRGAYMVRQGCPSRQGQRTPRQPLSFYRDLILYPFFRAPLTRAALMSGLQIVSQFATAAGFFRQSLARCKNGVGCPTRSSKISTAEKSIR